MAIYWMIADVKDSVIVTKIKKEETADEEEEEVQDVSILSFRLVF